jgi:hypothetical protein
MYTGNVSSLRQLACEYAQESIDRDTYLNNRGRLLDQLSGELPDEEDGETTVRLLISSVPDTSQSGSAAAQSSAINPCQKCPAEKLGGHRALIMAFWIVLGLGGVAIYMIASGEIF